MTSNIRDALAGAFQDPRPVGVIDENNGCVARKPRHEAVTADDAFFVRVPGWMTALDFDDERAISKSHYLFALLLIDGHRPVLVESGRPGHRHLICRGSKMNLHRLLRQGGITGGEARQTLRPPLSRHRLGGRGQLLIPSHADQVVDAIKGISSVRALGQHARWRIDQQDLGDEESVSEAVFGVAMGGANAGWTLTEFLTVVTCTRLGIGGLVAKRVAREGWPRTLTWLEQEVWPSAVRRVGDNPATAQGAGRADIDLVQWAVTTPWPGRGGPAQFAVLLALIAKRIISGRRDFDVSERELCEFAGISGRETVRGALAGLRERGLVTRTAYQGDDPAARLRQSPTWSLAAPPDRVALDARVDVLAALDMTAHDVFRNHVGLGKTALRVCCGILAVPGATTRDLADLLGLRTPHLRRVVAELRSAELVIEDDEGRLVLVDYTYERLEKVAADLGCAGRGVRQRNVFLRERSARDLNVRR